MAEASPRSLPSCAAVGSVVLLFIILFDAAVLYHSGGPAIYYHGRIRGKVDPWADIQRVAQNVSDKDDLFMVPPSWNDFGIYSHRASLGDWAEGSHALYLGSVFAAEWLARMNAIGWTGLMMRRAIISSQLGRRSGQQKNTRQNLLSPKNHIPCISIKSTRTKVLSSIRFVEKT